MTNYIVYFYSVFLFVSGTYLLVFPETVLEYFRRYPSSRSSWQNGKYADLIIRILGVYHFLFAAFLLVLWFEISTKYRR
jgi:hypothetical protein